MKKLALSLAIASALTLSACDDTTIDDVAKSEDPVMPSSRIVFDPSNRQISVPNDLLFSDTVDGTLNIPVADPDNYGDPQNALNALDGWSTQNAFTIGIDFPVGVSLDETSATMPGAVRIFEAIMGGPTSPDEQCQAVPQGAACKIVGELTFGVDFVTGPSGDSVAVVPLKPLKSASNYIVATTTVLQDSEGRDILGSTTYGLIRQDINEKPLASELQLLLQGLTNSFNNALATQAGVDLDTVSFSYAFTTESAGNVLSTIKQVLIADPARMPQGAVGNTGMTVLDILAGQGLLDPADPANTMFAAAQYYAGQVALPHFLDRTIELEALGADADYLGPLEGRWMANCDSGATLAGFIAAGGELPPATDPNDILCRSFGLADTAPYADLSPVFPIDVDRHLTKFNPIPELTGEPTLGGAVMVDVQMTLPVPAVANAVRDELGLPPLAAMGDWPVVILSHGITSRKEDMLALTGTLSLMGLATIAIDHPLHGSRGYDVNGDMVDDINASTISATHYMALGSLLTTRDNLRQSIADTMSLRIALHNLAEISLVDGQPVGMADIDPMNVSYVGHSLGGITGTTFLALANTTLGSPEADALYAVQAGVLGNPGGGVANFLMESPSFGGLIEASLVLGSSEEFQAYYAAYGTVPPGQPGFDDELVKVYSEFYELLDDAAKAQIESDKALFTFAAQTVTEAGDPNNYAPMLVANGTPILGYEMVGNGTSMNLPDQVIPNTTSSPIAGTEPLFRLLGLPAVTENVAGAEPSSGAVRFLFGHHGSLLDPRPQPGIAEENTGAVTAEMQQQLATYLVNGGKAILVSAPELILTPEPAG